MPSERSGSREARKSLRSSLHGEGGEALAVGLVVAEKYRLERLLKRGGMGSVWVATHLGLQSPVAIKFMAARLLDDDPNRGSDNALARFEREASAAAQIRMANVVQVLDYGVDQGIPYLVMELLEGEDLGARLSRVGRMSLHDASTIISSVARALSRAHDAGLVHRDLKPENIFLAKEGDDEVPKILDFGVAKAIRGDDQRAGDSTSEGTVVGTPFYISPEQAVGRTDIDHRSDLWSLGVIAFRMLTGDKPFKSELLLEVVVEICSAPIPRPTAISRDLPREVDAFMEQALAREPGERFATAKEFAAAFAELVGVDASRRRRRRARMIVAAIAVVLGAFAIVSWWALRSPYPPAQPGVASAPSSAPSSASTATSAASTQAAPSGTPASSAASTSASSASPPPPASGPPRGTKGATSSPQPSKAARPAVKAKPTSPGRDVGY